MLYHHSTLMHLPFVLASGAHVGRHWVSLDRGALRVERRGDQALRFHVGDVGYDVDRLQAASGEWGDAAQADQMKAVVECFASAVALDAPGAA
jgi:hypothetical protein